MVRPRGAGPGLPWGRVRGRVAARVINARRDASYDLASQKTLVMACSAALCTLLPVAAHQLGCLDHLPDPPGRVFASDKITGSRLSYPLGIPDSLLGLGSYTVTLALALNASRFPGVQKALALKLLADGSLASFNLVRQVVYFRRLCSWCTATALCTALMLVVERAAIRRQIAIIRVQMSLPSR
jgi:uncharacterized membrane protein